MSFCDEWIEKTTKFLPDECTTLDLIVAKIFTSPHCASMARKHGNGPAYVKLCGRVIYPKACVIDWLQKQKHEG